MSDYDNRTQGLKNDLSFSSFDIGSKKMSLSLYENTKMLQLNELKAIEEKFKHTFC
jgi:hypothetical protein